MKKIFNYSILFILSLAILPLAFMIIAVLHIIDSLIGMHKRKKR